MKRVLIAGLIICFHFSNAQTIKSWADSVLNTMTLPEKIGQLFMIPFSTYSTPEEIEAYETLITTYNPGSIYITKGSAKSHIRQVNKLQLASKVPLLVGMNAEWGLAQTLDSAMQFPIPIVDGANTDDSLIKELGYQIGLQMRAVGAHINFAPNADIDVPLESTVTNRYFGSDKTDVAQKSIAFADGLHQARVMAVAKHLPGIMPESSHIDSKESFLTVGPDSVSFYPYQQLIGNNIGGLLTTHLHFSTREKNKLIPAPISQIFISGIVKSQANFKGLAFTEIPYLQTIVKKKRGETEKIAFAVGNDILIAPQNLRAAVKKISKLVRKDKTMMARLETTVKKILEAKFEAGLTVEKTVALTNLDEKLFSPSAKLVDHRIRTGAITLLKNESGLVPIQQLDDRKFNLVKIGGDYAGLERSLNRYIPFNSFTIKDQKDFGTAEASMKDSYTVVALKSINTEVAGWIKKISSQNPTIVCHFGNPNDLKLLQDTPVLIEGYDAESTGEVIGQAIFGALPTLGKLPVGIKGVFEAGTHYESVTLGRLTYSVPEDAQMQSSRLTEIDCIVNEALAIGATPGAHVIIARKGKVVFNKSYGWQGVDKKIPVSENTIYDLASITKVTATLQAVMFLYERGMIDINKKISEYLAEFKGTNKKDIIIKDILTHQAGLWPYFPWHVDIMKDTAQVKQYFSKDQSEEYPFPVSENLFSHKSMRDSMWSWIIKSKMIEKKDRTPYEYRYSDLGLYIMQRLVQKLLNQPLEDFVEQNFYEPVGAPTMGFLPLNRFSPSQIAPTENDKDFRMSLLTGYVHDPGSAMHGGVAGHAGLFSNANDLLKMGQMWLQKGSYGGNQYLRPETVDRFTTRQFETSRRGLGWDKPTGDWAGSTGVYCSPKTFGHTGFTGTCVWIDPEFDLVFVFLSNRVHPEISGKLLSSNIRTRIQDVIYQSIFNYGATHNVDADKIISETKTSN
jgi:CubicO group peptidase (beta-lactamase class C family)/beta-glucosidase-like glycosyl hydrolase